MGLLNDIMGKFGVKQNASNNTNAASNPLQQAADVMGALQGDKASQRDLAEKAKGIIPGTVDDTLIDAAEKQFGLDKPAKK